MSDRELLGSGGESQVYALDDERVLRVYGARCAPYVERIAAFLRSLDRSAVPFALPEILEVDDSRETTRTVERRIRGTALSARLPSLTRDERRLALRRMTEAALWIRAVGVSAEAAGELMRDDAICRPTWREYLLARMHAALAVCGERLTADVKRFDDARRRIEHGIERLEEPAPRLVHGDYFPGNVIVDEDLSVTGVIDFGAHTFLGDPVLDLAGAEAFLPMGNAPNPGDTALVREIALKHARGDVLDLYIAWYAIYWAEFESSGPLYAWCVKTLRSYR